ncbi:hypothetical protein H7F15_16080 [Pontibacter sp. Tf4]|uniref:hypothetical protein n=1 Tax=Pontibacter sp. Tf4 TaxID=2761620 RepID=UPI001624476B|nr:hypothetical protein [Pontibacter sp. Tf4]MBB6612563.1 hypothetical protein [Pontibacter sp. Tf4]
MKKKAQRTVPVACRIFPEENEAIIKAAARRGMSRAQFITHLLSLTEYVADQQQADQHLKTLTQQLEVVEQQLQQAQASPWKQEPYATLLAKVLHNEQVLQELYASYGSKPVPVARLQEKHYHANVFLTGGREGDKQVQYTGTYGWANVDATRTHIIIFKRR